jgi:hypothetical protein
MLTMNATFVAFRLRPCILPAILLFQLQCDGRKVVGGIDVQCIIR